jgi:hypothetical protein
MDDALEHNGISAVGHVFEETSLLDPAPRCDPGPLKIGPTCRNDMRLVKQDTGGRRMSIEDGGKEGSVATPHIGNGAERREVISRQDCVGGLGRGLTEPRIEVLIQFRMLRPVFPLTHPKDMVKRRFARQSAVKKAAPRTDGLFPAEDRQAAKRARRLGSQACPKLGQPKAPVTLF